MFKHIRTKLLVYIIPSMIIVSVYGYFWNIKKITEVLDHQIDVKMLSMQREQVRRVREPYLRIQKTAEDTAIFIGHTYNSEILENYQKMFVDYIHKEPNIYGIGVWFEPYVFDSESKYAGVYVENSNNNVKSNFKYFTEEYDYFNQEFYLLAKKKNSFGATKVYYDEISEKYFITCYEPVTDDIGNYIGCIAIDIDLGKIKELLNEYNSEDSIFFVMDSDGVYIDKLQNSNVETTSTMNDVKEKVYEEVSKIISKKPSGRIDVNINNEKFMAYYSTVDGLNITLTYVIPNTILTEQIDIVSRHYIMVTCIMLLNIIFAISLVFKVSIDKPLKLLLEEFEKIANNTYTLEVPDGITKHTDEIGTIGNSLEMMKEKLYKYQNNLTTLVEKNEAYSIELKSQNQLLVKNAHDLRTLYEYNNALINTIPELVFVVSKEKGQIINCHGGDNSKIMPNEYYINKCVGEFTTKENEDIVLEKIKNISGTDDIVQFDIQLEINGELEHYDMRIADWLEDRVIVVGRNITEFNNSLKKIEYLSFNDQVTELHNRRHYEKRIIELSEEKYLPLSIVMADVNGLKFINDSFGHEEGDKLLKGFANVLKRTDIDPENYARIGGDEFVILLPNTKKEDAEKIVNKIMVDCRNEVILGLELSVSFGVDDRTDIDQSMDSVFKNAEDRMYQHKLYESSSRKSKIIDIVVSTLQEKNTNEQMHSERVAEYCEKMANALELNKSIQRKISSAGMLHDIGKIGIPESLLDKKTYLTDEEFEIMRKHPEIGYRILKSAGNMDEIAEIILSHHERWDGGGYPRKLKGEEITYEARIIAIVDAYDTIINSSCYKSAVDEEVAILELRKHAGTQFDPELVEIFITKVLQHK